jgi:hypothetical protein
MLLHDVRLGQIHFHKTWVPIRTAISPDCVAKATRLHARLLAPSVHPLLGPDVFALLTRYAMTANWAIDYESLELNKFLETPTIPGEA